MLAVRPREPRLALAGRVVLITGAAQGIGLALARHLLAQHAEVALVDLDGAAVRRAASEWGPRAFARDADVRDRGAMAEAVDATVRHFGGLDVVVANAGVTPTPATLRTMNSDDFDRVLDINLIGAFNTVKPALDHVIKRRGHVVFVSSGAAFSPGVGGSPYMISKAAVEQLGRALRLELVPFETSVQTAYFGIVETAMTHDMLDADDLGRRLDALLPWPLNVRITAAQAARTIADGIERRAPRTIAPRGWEPYALLRGAVNVVADRLLAASSTVHQLVHAIEERR